MKLMNQISELANKYFSVISVLFAVAALFGMNTLFG